MDSSASLDMNVGINQECYIFLYKVLEFFLIFIAFLSVLLPNSGNF